MVAKYSPLTSPKLDRRNQGLEVPERFIEFNLMASMDWEPTWIAREIALILKSSWSFPGVEHLAESRFRIIRGLGPPCRFICPTRRLGGNGKCAYHDDRSQRGGEMLPR
ncbi:MAG TPA: hypothetical protein VN968_10890 [Bradyrhizobium sp.]|nr:hypothetical protein [Bradyrhizobium sp.]